MQDDEKKPKKTPRSKPTNSKRPKKAASKKSAPKRASKKKSNPAPPPLPPDLDNLLEGVPLPASALSGLFQSMEDPATLRREQDMRSMVGRIQEYLDSYILIGYTMDGRPINITYAANNKDSDALSAALQRYVLEGMHRQFPPGL